MFPLLLVCAHSLLLPPPAPTPPVSWWSIVPSFLLTLTTQLGDKSFLIVSLLARRQSRLLVLISAVAGLAITAAIGCLLGTVLAVVVPAAYVSIAAFCLFLLLSFLSFEEGLATDEKVDLREVERRVCGDGSERRGWGRRMGECLEMVCRAEWGDRMQLACVVMAAEGVVEQVFWGVVAGAVVSMGAASIGGVRLFQSLSERPVSLASTIVFLGFAMLTLILG